MDSLTHIVVGACAGELIAGKKLGKKAMLIGAIANSLPDIDIVCSLFLPLSKDLLAHRGFTHSFLFALLVTPLLAWMSKRWVRSGMTFTIWCWLWGSQVLLHDFIDAFNAYGTGWFEPFSHYRVSFNTMFVADPLFTLWPAFVTVLLLFISALNGARRRWAGFALTLSACYLLSGIFLKSIIDTKAKEQLARNGTPVKRYLSTPTPLNNLLWYIVAEQDSGFYIGYRSVFDGNRPTKFRFTCRNAALLSAATDKAELERLLRFSQGFYTAEMQKDTLKFNVLRFGEIIGWNDTASHCVFYYYPQHPTANELVVQRGRFARWDGEQLRLFLRRIAGR
ncbi:MAG: metal-dependent hydrolase [Taibaiella sp.]|nr:metal-dependent hydrolase [Taibaiella sp.]